MLDLPILLAQVILDRESAIAPYLHRFQALPISSVKVLAVQDFKLVPSAFGPGFFLTFLYYFSGTTLVGSLIAAQSLHVSYGTGIPMQMGAVVGLLGGGIGGYFNRSATLEVSFSKRKKFLPQLNAVLTELGYSHSNTFDSEAGESEVGKNKAKKNKARENKAGEIMVYQRPPLRQLFSGKVYVQITAKTATITSRALHLRTLRQRLSATV